VAGVVAHAAANAAMAIQDAAAFNNGFAIILSPLVT
jgi:hypothetical protein